MVEEVFRLVSGTMLNVVGDTVPWVKWFIHASGYMAEMKKVKGELDGIVQELLDLKKGESNDGSRPEDFVDVMLGQKTETGESRLTHETIRGVIQVIIISSHTTMCYNVLFKLCVSCMSWCSFLQLAMDPYMESCLFECMLMCDLLRLKKNKGKLPTFSND